MNSEELNKKKIMHIDTSGKLHENKNTGIAYKTIRTNLHKGLVLSIKFKKELKKRLNINKDYARIYAICIYYLIEEDMDKFDILVICGDEKYHYTKKYLDLLFKQNKKYSNKKIISLYKFRKITGNKNLKSYANGIANSYRKRGLKSKGRRQRGVSLNIIEINYNEIKNKWKEI